MSKSSSYPTSPRRGTPEYLLTKELQRLRRFGVSDLAFRPAQYPQLSALRLAAGTETEVTMEVLAESKALFRAAFDMFPTSNLRQAAAVLFHVDSESTPPPLADRRRSADRAFVGCNSARHEETVRRTLERDIDRMMVEFLPRVACTTDSSARLRGNAFADVMDPEGTVPVGTTTEKTEVDPIEAMVSEDGRGAAAFRRRVALSFANQLALDELEQSVIDLGRSYVCRPARELAAEIREVRASTFQLIEHNRHPNQMRQLYLIACRACGLQAHVALDFGNFLAAGTQARTAWLFAELAGEHGARGWIRAMQSLIAYWDGHLEEAVTFAEDGRRYAQRDSIAVRLPSLEARARSAIGDRAGTLLALAHAKDAQAKAQGGVAELGGVFSFPEGKQAAYAGTARLALDDPEQVPFAVEESQRAIQVYGALPQEEQSSGDMLAARLDLVTAYLQGGVLDGAECELDVVLSAPPERRTASILKRARKLSNTLEAPRYRSSSLAKVTRERLDLFCLSQRAPALPPKVR